MWKMQDADFIKFAVAELKIHVAKASAVRAIPSCSRTKTYPAYFRHVMGNSTRCANTLTRLKICS